MSKVSTLSSLSSSTSDILEVLTFSIIYLFILYQFAFCINSDKCVCFVRTFSAQLLQISLQTFTIFQIFYRFAPNFLIMYIQNPDVHLFIHLFQTKKWLTWDISRMEDLGLLDMYNNFCRFHIMWYICSVPVFPVIYLFYVCLSCDIFVLNLSILWYICSVYVYPVI